MEQPAAPRRAGAHLLCQELFLTYPLHSQHTVLGRSQLQG